MHLDIEVNSDEFCHIVGIKKPTLVDWTRETEPRTGKKKESLLSDRFGQQRTPVIGVGGSVSGIWFKVRY